MNSFSWNYRDDWGKRENDNKRKDSMIKKEHTRLVIDEDSIYEIDLDCIECKEKGKENQF